MADIDSVSNCIVLEFKQKRTLVEFLLHCGIATLTSKRCNIIFTPIPPSWVERKILVEHAIESLCINTNVDNIIQMLEIARDDDILISKIGIETYQFIKFILSINKAISIERCRLILDVDDNDYNASVSLVQDVKLKMQEKRFQQFRLTYSKEIESYFNDKKTIFLYHGTPAENLTPIMANGLKNCSGTDMQLHGAVHGSGIYLSDSIEFSLGYCGGLSGGNQAMLIYEVIDNPKWFKTTNIFVVDDEHALILRYIIIINGYNSTINTKIFKDLNTFLASGKLKETVKKKESATANVLTKAYNKRLMIEYKKIANASPDILGFTLQLATDDNLRVWIIRIMKLDNPSLEKQMQSLNIPYIELEISFPEGYPIDPPFPRMLYPRFKSLTGHITDGGSICMEAISTSGWVPTTNMEALITQIKMILSDGGAKIEEDGYGKRYGMAEAKDAFKRAMAVHGW